MIMLLHRCFWGSPATNLALRACLTTSNTASGIAETASNIRQSEMDTNEVLRKRPNVSLCWLQTWRANETATTSAKLKFEKSGMRQIDFTSLRAPKERSNSAKTSVAKA